MAVLKGTATLFFSSYFTRSISVTISFTEEEQEASFLSFIRLADFLQLDINWIRSYSLDVLFFLCIACHRVLCQVLVLPHSREGDIS